MSDTTKKFLDSADELLQEVVKKPVFKSLFCVYDSASRVFNAPQMMENESVAVRAFRDVVLSDNGLISRHPEDFALYFVGYFDCENGNIIPNVKLIISADKILADSREVKVNE